MKRAIRKLIGRPRLRHNIQIEPEVQLLGCEFVGQVRIGYRSYANDTLFRNAEVGRFCSIGRRCSIGAARHDLTALTSHPSGEAGDHDNGPTTRIGNDVWIGDNVVIVSGLTLGDGAVIGAGAIVTRDVAPYSIVAGVPAREIRPRFAPALAERLLRARWWRFGGAAIRRGEAIEAALDRIEAAPPQVYEPGFRSMTED